jgi:hypothetical protein
MFIISDRNELIPHGGQENQQQEKFKSVLWDRPFFLGSWLGVSPYMLPYPDLRK